MRQLESVRPWLIGFVVVGLASIAVDAAQAPRARIPTLQENLAPYLAKANTNRPIQAAVIVQKSDCTGNLRMLSLLHKEGVRERMQLAVIWYEGAVNDSSDIRASLPSWTRTVPMVPLQRSTLARLRELGHDGTPLLLVMDQFGRIRFTSQSPRSPREFAGLARIVDGLTWVEEL